MKTMYRIGGWRLELKAFDVVEETNKTVVFVDNRFGFTHKSREAKNAQDQEWFADFEEAKKRYIDVLQGRKKSTEESLAELNQKLSAALTMTKETLT